MKREEADFVRVSIDHFELPAQEISRLWALQEKYIDLLESKLRRASQQEKTCSQYFVVMEERTPDQILHSFEEEVQE